MEFSRTDGVDVADSTLRKVEVDDEIDSDEVDTSTENLSAYQNPNFSAAKCAHSFVALREKTWN